MDAARRREAWGRHPVRACVAILALAVAFASTASPPPATPADGFHVWLPGGGRLPPAPFELAVVRTQGGHMVKVGTPALSATHGSLEKLPGADPYVLRLLFVPAGTGRADVAIRAGRGAGAAEATVHLDPAVAGTVKVSVSPSAMVKGPGAKAEVTIALVDAHGHPLDARTPPVVAANVGTLTGLSRSGPGVWTATYHPSAARYPEVAVLTAFHPWPHRESPAVAVGSATLPLSAAIDLPGHTRANVQMTVEIAGKRFGPVPADRHGAFKVPVVVPPGHGTGRGVSRDRFGNRRVTSIDLQLPPTNRLAVAAQPTTLVADGHSRAQVVLYVVDRYGHPAKGSAPVLEADHGKVTTPVEAGLGAWRAWYVAPRTPGDGHDMLGVHFGRRDPSKAKIAITLVSGPPVRLSTDLSPPVVPAPSKTPATLTVHAVDRDGAPAAGVVVTATIDRGRLDAPSHSGPGEVTLAFHAPPTPAGWQATVHLTAQAPDGTEPVSAAIEPATGRLVVVDALGRPVPRARVRLGGVAAVAGADGTLAAPAGDGAVVVTLPAVALPVRIHRGRDAKGGLHAWPAAEPPLRATVALPLMRPVPVWIEAEARTSGRGRAVVRWKIRGGHGKRKVWVEGAQGAPVEGQGRSGTMTIAAAPGSSVTVTDEATGISAVAVVAGR